MELKKIIFLIDFVTNNSQISRFLGLLAVSPQDWTVNKSVVKKALQHNILTQTNKKLTFSSVEIHHFFLAINYLEENCNISSTRDLENFFSKRVLERDAELTSKFGGGMYIVLFLLILNRIFGIDVASLIVKIDDHRKIFGIYYAECLPYLEGDVNNLADALIASTSDMYASMNYFNVHEAVREASFLNPAFGLALVSKCNDFRKQEMFVPDTFYGLTLQQGLDNTIWILEERIAIGSEEALTIVLESLQKLGISQTLLESNETTLLGILDRLRNTLPKHLTGSLIIAYGNLVNFSNQAKNKIDEICSTELSEHTAISFCLMLNTNVKSMKGDEWFHRALSYVNDLNKLPSRCYYLVGLVLFEYINHDNKFVLHFLNNFFSSSNFNYKNVRGLESFIGRVLKAKDGLELIQQWLTQWFNSDEPKHHAAAGQICNILSTYNISKPKLDKELLQTFSIQDVSYTLFKVLGYVYLKDHLESLVFSFTNYKDGKNNDLNNLVIKAFCEYILYNYKSSMDYLQTIKRKSSNIQKQIISKIEKYYNAVFAQTAEKPLELQPSLERMDVLMSKFKSNFSDDEYDKFRMPSFLDDVKKVDVKLGGSFFIRGDNGKETLNNFNNSNKMSSFSTSMEMPMEVITDPVYWEYNRRVWRSYKRKIV